MNRRSAHGQPLAYYLRRAVDSILATPVIAGVTITSIAVSVLLAGAVLLVGSNAYRLIASWGAAGVDVSIYLNPGVDDCSVNTDAVRLYLRKMFPDTPLPEVSTG